MGSLIDMKAMGVISIATSLSGLCVGVSTMLSGKILFPAYAELHREADHGKLYSVVGRARVVQMFFIWAASFVLLLIARPLIGAMYDSRYSEAASIIEVMAIGNFGVALNISYVFLEAAIKRPDLTVRIVLSMALSLWISVYIGHHFWGASGVIYGLAASGWISYPLVSSVYRGAGFWYPRSDLLIISM